MPSVEEDVRKSINTFYDALELLLLSKGLDAMSDAWHHTDAATTIHPFGHWAHGWEEVWATWQEIAAVYSFYHGHEQRKDGIGGIHDLHISVMGDVACASSLYKSCIYLPEGETLLSVNCTNIAQRINGVWKVVHHHPDQATPEFQAAMARLVESGQRG
ncbi:MAG TPA: nuclear transport factor 2 family protein [Polyangiaceae bacterium]|jgi:ketosteroid isomerase-like protein